MGILGLSVVKTNGSKLTGTILLAHEIKVRFYFVLVIPYRSFDYEFLNLINEA